MIKKIKYSISKIVAIFGFVFLVIMACKDEPRRPENSKETIIEGSVSIMVDETLQPIVEEQVQVFESQYRAKITMVNKPESEIVNALLKGESNLAILSRNLTPAEQKVFDAKKIKPRVTIFARDAIAFISNKAANDTLIDLQEVINLMQGKPSKIKGLVFENPNSSTVRYMNELAGVKNGEKKGIYSLKSHEEVLKYVSENSGVIGVVGLNLLLQPSPEWQQFNDKVNVMGVRNVKNQPNNTLYYKPSQANIGAGVYPLNRQLYMLNYQGTAGLGMGFASFIAGEIGQRIVLKAGLVPVRIPSRIISVRKDIINTK